MQVVEQDNDDVFGGCLVYGSADLDELVVAPELLASFACGYDGDETVLGDVVLYCGC